MRVNKTFLNSCRVNGSLSDRPSLKSILRN